MRPALTTSVHGGADMTTTSTTTTSVLDSTLEIVPELRARAEQAANDRRLPVGSK